MVVSSSEEEGRSASNGETEGELVAAGVGQGHLKAGVKVYHCFGGL